ncbi:MAG: glycosyl hydrolase [Burkholderiales bacterium]|nr:glycosyl hydrolase [Burkholderiales bacterium]
MNRRRFGRTLLAAALPAVPPFAAAAWRDPLDVPAEDSALAPRGLINGLARAGRRIVAVGQRGHALASDDGGLNWKQGSVPVSSDLVALSFPTAQAGWAVGHDGVVLHSDDGGSRWTRQLDGRGLGPLMRAAYGSTADEKLRTNALHFADQGTENPLLDVWFEDARNGWAVGAFGLALRTADGGAHWEPMLHAVDNPKGLHLYAVRGIAGRLFIAGEQGLLLEFDRPDGRFRVVELPTKGSLFGLIGNEHFVLAHGLRGSMVRSAGQGWQPVASGVAVGLTASTFDDHGRIVVVSQAGHVLRGNDDASAFSPMKVERPTPTAAVVAAPTDRLVLGGPRGVYALALT